jgi:hypothetical protein
MSDVTIGLLHPGEMGAAVGRCLADHGYAVLWTPEGLVPLECTWWADATRCCSQPFLAGVRR